MTPESPYLPPPRNPLAQWLSDQRYRLVYRLWKRAVQSYCRRERINPQSLSILEVGFGAGNLLYWLRRWFPDSQIKAIDSDPQLLAHALRRTPAVTFQQASACDLAEPANHYDIITCLQVIEHLPDPDDFLRRAAACLKPGGLLLLATPNPQSLAARWLKDRWQGIRPDHISLRIITDLQSDIYDSGLTIIKQGTTLFNGIPIIGRFPLSLPFQFLQAIFGFFPWPLGESYMAIIQKPHEATRP